MTGKPIPKYHYRECGLDNVFVIGVKSMVDDDGELVVSIPKVNQLHKAISIDLVCKPAMLSGKEIRYLRTEMGMTQGELAEFIHRDHQTIGRWERGECPVEATADTLLRLLAIEKLRLPLKARVQEISRRSVECATSELIEIDGRDPGKCRPLKAA